MVERLSVRGRLLLGSALVPGHLIVEDGRIVEIARHPADLPPDPVIEAEIVAPGLIDLQVNGGFGADVGADPDAIRSLAQRLPETGVTAFLPTVITSPADFYPSAFAAFEAARDAPGACPLGLHLEGPFLSPKRHGAHRRDLIESADPALIDTFLACDSVRLITLAPERLGAPGWIRRFRERGVAVSLGHTNASIEAFAAGVDAGATMATHLYNAMSPFEHRAPNAIGAALTDDRVTVGLIADGVHSHPASVALALRAKGFDRVALVTDMASAAGMSPGAYQLGGRTVLLDGSSVRLEDGTLAGSALMLDEAVRNVVSWTATPPEHALRMAAEIPARILGMDHLGQIRVGNDADLVLLHADLQVRATIVGGKIVYERLHDR